MHLGQKRQSLKVSHGPLPSLRYLGCAHEASSSVKSFEHEGFKSSETDGRQCVSKHRAPSEASVASYDLTCHGCTKVLDLIRSISLA